MLPRKEHGFMTYKREVPSNVSIEERVKNHDEFVRTLPEEHIRQQAYRCMNCGVPFCHSACPLGNIIPDANDAVKDGRWRKALDIFHSTNNFPEFTGRVCPAPCETGCVLGIDEPPVAIEFLERAVADRGWSEGWVTPEPPENETGKRVAIVGSGPAGLAAAQQLRRAGHKVVVFERADEPGGLLLYGIPAFKLSKTIVQRRIVQLTAEGVEFRCNAWIGHDVPTSELEGFDAVLLTTGSTEPRRLDIPGADLDGIHLAMDFLPQQTRRLLGKEIQEPTVNAAGKRVLVIGGGDTGSDCVGTSHRQGAKTVCSLELMPQPPLDRADSTPWPMWPYKLRTSSSYKEGGDREWSVLTKSFEGEGGCVKRLRCVRVEWIPTDSGRPRMQEIADSEFVLEADLVLLALGFVHPEQDTVVADLGLDLDPRGNIQAGEDYQTNKPGVFAAGDARRGQSLVVWAIYEGREAARCIDLALAGHTDLPGRSSYGYDGLAK